MRSELPSEAESPSIEIQRADRPFATFYLSVSSNNLDLSQLTEYLSREVQPELSTLPGVQRVGIEGARNLAMRIWLDPDKMSALDLTPIEVQQALLRNNYLAAVGRTRTDSTQIDLLTDTDLRSVEEFDSMIVRQVDARPSACATSPASNWAPRKRSPRRGSTASRRCISRSGPAQRQ